MVFLAFIVDDDSIRVPVMECDYSLAKICRLPGGVFAAWHKMVMVRVLLDMRDQRVFPYFEGSDVNTTRWEGVRSLKWQDVAHGHGL